MAILLFWKIPQSALVCFASDKITCHAYLLCPYMHILLAQRKPPLRQKPLMFCKSHVLSRRVVRRADIGSSSGTGDSCQTNNAGAAAPAAPADGHSRFDCSLTEHALTSPCSDCIQASEHWKHDACGLISDSFDLSSGLHWWSVCRAV